MEFEKFRTMQFPRDIYVGHGVLSQIKNIAKRNIREGTVVIITGENTIKLAGNEVSNHLTDAAIDNHIIVTGAASYENLESCISQSKEFNAGLMVGVGGGSKIDLAKKIAYILNIPFVSVPTTPSHDGIASPRASIKKNGWSVSEQAAMPVSIIADTSIMVKVPFKYLAAGAADVISNETAILDWKLANRIKGEEFSSSAAAIAEYAAKELIEKAHLILPGVEESVWLVVKQILASGTSMAIASSSRPASGSEHLIAHNLENLAPGKAIHGEQCAIGSVVSMFLHWGDWKSLVSTYSKFGLSIKARDYGIPEDLMIEAVRTAHRIRKERYTILGEVDLSREASQNALYITGIL